MNSFTVIVAHREGQDEELFKKCMMSIEQNILPSASSYEIITATEGDRCESRNNAAFKTDNDILIFFDDDVEVHNNCIAELLKPFSMFENVGVVGGPNVTFRDAPKEEKLVGRLWSNPLIMLRSSARYTSKGDIRVTDEAELQSCNCAILRKAFIEAGGFPNIIPNEENILFNRIQKLGYKLVYNPFAIVRHRRPKLYKEFAKKMFFYGKGRGYMMRMGSKPKMFYSLNMDTFILIVGAIVSYFSYISGVIYGILTYKGMKKR